MKKWPVTPLYSFSVKTGHYGGSYKVTKDLYKKIGIRQPIAENSFTGMAVAAMTGLRPIIKA